MRSGVFTGRLAACAMIVATFGGRSSAESLSADECRALLRLDSVRPALRDAAVRNVQATALRAPDAQPIRAVTDAVVEMDEDADVDRLCRSFGVEPAGAALLTGYYRPVVPARRTRQGEFQYPLHALPAGELRTRTRAEIDGGALDGTTPVIAWLADPVEAFFIHIQGSAVLELPGGRTAVGYAGSNDRPYTSIGARLIAEGRMPRGGVSMESLKQYLQEHPEERDRILHLNERYIFFREVPDVPVGSLGVPLTDGRSVAADPAVHPPGSLLFIRPRDSSAGVTPRLVFVQDRGSAIVGPRLDLYVGTGAEAGRIAGALQQEVDVFVVRPQ